MKPSRLLTALAVVGLSASMLGSTAAASAATAGSARSPAVSLQNVTLPSIPRPGEATSSFPLVNANSDLCLGIAGGADDAPAVQWTCNDSANQAWHWGSSGILGVGLVYYQLINGDGQCLGVAGNSTAEGAQIYGWSCNGAANQYWYANDGVITNYHSSKVVGVAGNSEAVGAAIVQWPFTNALNQYWYD
jgi:hypothetical protein